MARERTAYQLDGAGNRIEESLERWNGSTWVSASWTTHEFTCHLDKVTRGAGGPNPSVTEYCYDLNDNLEKVWDQNHPRALNPTPTQLYSYDVLNRLTSVTQPWTGAGGGGDPLFPDAAISYPKLAWWNDPITLFAGIAVGALLCRVQPMV